MSSTLGIRFPLEGGCWDYILLATLFLSRVLRSVVLRFMLKQIKEDQEAATRLSLIFLFISSFLIECCNLSPAKQTRNPVMKKSTLTFWSSWSDLLWVCSLNFQLMVWREKKKKSHKHFRFKWIKDWMIFSVSCIMQCEDLHWQMSSSNAFGNWRGSTWLGQASLPGSKRATQSFK